MTGRTHGIAPSHRRARIGAALLAATLSACTPSALTDLPGEFTRAARDQVLATLSAQYTQRLGASVNGIIADLAEPGGFIDNPLVRILLPPPVGMALAVVRGLQTEPDAFLIETVMNEVAAQAIPGAAPIVQAALAKLTPAEARRLLEGGETAGTEHLKATTAAALQAALTPIVNDKLAGSGAQLIYGELVEAYQAQQAVVPSTDTSVPTPEPSPELGAYVAERTVDGLFKVLAEREADIRKDLDRATGELLQPERNM
jgi:hypothetical protein